MRILLLNQYFHPDVAATAQLATDLAIGFAGLGHEVTAVASARRYAGRGTLSLRERYRGVDIVRVPATAFGRGGRLGRAADYATFLAGALLPIVAARRPDVVVALSTPPFVGSLALVAKALRGTRFVYWVMDVYPEVAIRLGAVATDGRLTAALRAVGASMLRHADAVVALDDAMRLRLIADGADPAKVVVIDNWSDDEIQPDAAAHNRLRSRLGLGDEFTVSYSGNMGLGHDFETVLDAMRRLRGTRVHWLFIGNGPQRQLIERAVRAEALPRVSMLDYVPRAELSVSLTAAHASLVTLADGMAGLMVPSKLYGLLAAGTPVLYVGPAEGRVHELVCGEGVGFSVRNGDSAALADAIRRLATDAGARADMGRKARTIYERRFSRARAIDRYHRLVQALGAAAGPANVDA